MIQEMQVEQVAALERANYAAIRNWVQATPGSTMTLRDDLILTRAHLFPTPDVNHACLLHATEADVERLIDDVCGYFQRLKRKTHVFVSPACTPPDLGERLMRRGFEKQEREEAWLVLDLRVWQPPSVGWDAVEVVRAGHRDARTFAHIFLTSFGMTPALTPLVVLFIKRLMRVPTTHYYLAFVDGQAVGACLQHSYDGTVCAGAMGVLPAFRGSKVATTLMKHIVLDAQEKGNSTVIAQTMNLTLGEFACKYGFKRAFTRTHYVLSR